MANIHGALSEAMAGYEHCKCATWNFKAHASCLVLGLSSLFHVRTTYTKSQRVRRSQHSQIEESTPVANIRCSCMCRKLVDTPFPFPWAQAMSILLTFAIVTPVVIVGHTTAIWTSIWITWAAVQTHVMLNEVCVPCSADFSKFEPVKERANT